MPGPARGNSAVLSVFFSVFLLLLLLSFSSPPKPQHSEMKAEYLQLAICCWLASFGRVAATLTHPSSITYAVTASSADPLPVLSFLTGNSAFQQVFNAAWVSPSPQTGYKAGLLVRSQNCSATPGGACLHCGGVGEAASQITFAELSSGGGAQDAPVFLPVTNASIEFGHMTAATSMELRIHA
eukprot:m.406847 g.406847  ORF g.406847 m.406847 type:complete len:183 (+) comp56501_c0_seq5:985-1533(+)